MTAAATKARPKATPKPKASTRSAKPTDLTAAVALARDGNADAIKMIAKLATPSADQALVDLLLDAEGDVREQASMALAKAGRKRPELAERVVATCTARPKATDADAVMVRFAELAINDKKLVKDRRTLALLRRQLTCKPVGVSADELSAQEMAVATLVSLRDRASLQAIVGLLEQEDRASLWFNICDAASTLGGGRREQANLQRALERVRDYEQGEVEKVIARLSKRLR